MPQIKIKSLNSGIDSKIQPSLTFSFLFSIFWAFQHILEKSDQIFVKNLSILHFTTIICVILSAFLLLLKPQNKILFFIFCTISLIDFLVELPKHANHMFLIETINIIIIVGFIKSWQKNRSFDKNDLRKIKPFIRISIAILYSFAVFHKLNRGYFSPEFSCAVYLKDKINIFFNFLPRVGYEEIYIYSSLIIESSIPLLLFIKKTRTLGLIIGLCFHLFLSILVPHFSLLMFILYFCFIPEGVYKSLSKKISINFFYLLKSTYIILLLSSVGIYIAHYFAFYKKSLDILTTRALWSFVLEFIFLIMIVIIFLNKSKISHSFNTQKVTNLGKILLCFLILNGLSPYIGIKTGTSFSMYSNLVTEKSSNHFLMKSKPIQLIDTQDELVYDLLYRKHFPLINSYRYFSENPYKEQSLKRFIFNDLHYSENEIIRLQSFKKSENYLIRKFLIFRHLNEPKESCKW